MHIEVTADDIHSGHPGMSESCALAKAIRRCAHTHEVWVSPRNAFVRGRKMPLPDIAQVFVRDYDCDNPVAPIEFDL